LFVRLHIPHNTTIRTEILAITVTDPDHNQGYRHPETASAPTVTKPPQSNAASKTGNEENRTSEQFDSYRTGRLQQLLPFRRKTKGLQYLCIELGKWKFTFKRVLHIVGIDEITDSVVLAIL
jgi:hypothetical protein